MMRKLLLALGALSLGLPGAASAQSGPTTPTPTSSYPCVTYWTGTTFQCVDTGHPLPTSGGSGGGGGPVTAADGAIVTMGSKADAKSTATDTTPASMISLLKGQIDRLQAMITALGTPFQAGGSIGNTAFGISGQLPSFASTQTFNIGTAPAIVLGAGSATIGSIANSSFGVSSLPSLPAGSNTIGSIANTSFGVSSLPALPAGSNTIGSVTAWAATTPYNQSLAAGASTNIPTSGSFQTAPAWASYYRCRVSASPQTYSLYIQETPDGSTITTPRTAASVTAGTITDLSLPVLGTGQVRGALVNNSGTAGTFIASCGFTAN